MGKVEPLPTVTREEGEEAREGEWSIPGSEAMCAVAPESMTHSPTVEGEAALFRAATRVTVLTWSRRSYLPRSTRISILHLVKLEVLRLSVTGTWVRTLATFTAGDEEAGRRPAGEEPSAGDVGATRAPMVAAPRAPMVAAPRAEAVASLAAGVEAIEEGWGLAIGSKS
jgi:hypothetical protein